jgi:hypothetical protein
MGVQAWQCSLSTKFVLALSPNNLRVARMRATATKPTTKAEPPLGPRSQGGLESTAHLSQASDLSHPTAQEADDAIPVKPEGDRAGSSAVQSSHIRRARSVICGQRLAHSVVSHDLSLRGAPLKGEHRLDLWPAGPNGTPANIPNATGSAACGAFNERTRVLQIVIREVPAGKWLFRGPVIPGSQIFRVRRRPARTV